MNKNSKAVKLFLSLSMVTALTACNNVPDQNNGGEEGSTLPTDNAPVSVEQQPNLILASATNPIYSSKSDQGQESGEQADDGQESGEQADDGQESGEQADDGQESGEQADDGQESGEGQEAGEQGEGQESGETDKVKKVPGNR